MTTTDITPITTTHGIAVHPTNAKYFAVVDLSTSTIVTGYVRGTWAATELARETSGASLAHLDELSPAARRAGYAAAAARDFSAPGDEKWEQA